MTEWVAEIGANHCGDYQFAVDHMHAAKVAGATMVKFQLWCDPMTADVAGPLIAPDSPWHGVNLRELYAKIAMPLHWPAMLVAEARRIGVKISFSVFDVAALSILEPLNVDAYKVASFEITDIALIDALAQTMRPLALSCGMADARDIKYAVKAARGDWPARGPNRGINPTLLACCSAYPAHASGYSLARFRAQASALWCPWGLSDHTLTPAVAIAAAAQGATLVEKHFILRSRSSRKSPDLDFSITPDQFREMVDLATDAIRCSGHTSQPSKAEADMRLIRRTLYWARSASAGTRITPDDVRTARPALGILPYDGLAAIERGAVATRDVVAGGPVMPTDLGPVA